jgi:multidrug efflux pump subunit AcrA (membrane-fusion protein)
MKFLNLIIVIALFYSCANENDVVFPQKRNLIESVYSSIIIQPDSLYQSYAIVAGILDNNLVEEGDLVSKGQAIIQIINSTPKLNAQNAKFALDLAKENYNGSAAVLRGIEDEIAAANLKYQNDSINYFRQKKLWGQNIGSKAEYDSRKLTYDLSLNNINLLRSRYYRTKNELDTAVKQAQNNYSSSLIATKDFTVKSKINGKIYALYKNAGELVTNMEPLATIGSENKFIIEMLVDEVDIVRISKNQEVLINLDAYNGKVFTGIVSKILPKKDERNQTFKVEALFDKAPDILYPGLSGEANIIIARKDNILVIPKEYLTEDNKVMTNDGLIDVALGIENLEFVEIISGISEETQIIKPEE